MKSKEKREIDKEFLPELVRCVEVENIQSTRNMVGKKLALSFILKGRREGRNISFGFFFKSDCI